MYGHDTYIHLWRGDLLRPAKPIRGKGSAEQLVLATFCCILNGVCPVKDAKQPRSRDGLEVFAGAQARVTWIMKRGGCLGVESGGGVCGERKS
jgi:hypothetical protein